MWEKGETPNCVSNHLNAMWNCSKYNLLQKGVFSFFKGQRLIWAMSPLCRPVCCWKFCKASALVIAGVVRWKSMGGGVTKRGTGQHKMSEIGPQEKYARNAVNKSS